jgi:hypothetical protein
VEKLLNSQLFILKHIEHSQAGAPRDAALRNAA